MLLSLSIYIWKLRNKLAPQEMRSSNVIESPSAREYS